jgi:hypothetical protein
MMFTITDNLIILHTEGVSVASPHAARTANGTSAPGRSHGCAAIRRWFVSWSLGSATLCQWNVTPRVAHGKEDAT